MVERKNSNRREFIKNSTIAGAGLVVSSLGAGSYSRVLGANDRISIGVVGCSRRGRIVLMPQVFGLEKEANVEVTAVCDIWSVNRENGEELIQERTGRKPLAYKYLDEMLNNKDIDAVIVATGDPQHAPLLTRVVNAGKDCYCEKPMAINLKEAKEAVAAVKSTGQIVQIGTGGLSSPNLWGLKKFIGSGQLGKISRVDTVRNNYGPRWRGRIEPSLIKESDTDWREWLGDHPHRPFDPKLYFEFRTYKDFSTGSFGQWMSHDIAAVALAMGATFPESVVAHGGNFVWEDGREIPDTVILSAVYPSGWMYTYSSNFGNNYRGHTRYYGTNGTIEGNRVSGTGGGHDDTPENREREKRVAPAGEPAPVNPHKVRDEVRIEPDPEVAGRGGHMQNWIDCMRSRKTPNADVTRGYYDSVVCIMGHQSVYSGKMLYWDFEKEEIVESRPRSTPS